MSERASIAIAVLNVADPHRRKRRCAPTAVTGYAHGRERTPVVAVAKGENLVRAPVAGSQQHSRLIGLGSRAHEVDLGVIHRSELRDLLGQLDGGLDQIERRTMNNFSGLVPNRLDDLGDVVPGRGREDAAEEIQITPAF